MEVLCTKEEIETICLNNWGSNNCKSSTSVVHIDNNNDDDSSNSGVENVIPNLCLSIIVLLMAIFSIL